MMNVKGFQMLTRNEEFVDAIFEVEMPEEEKKLLGLKYCDYMTLLCLTYDKYGTNFVVGIMDGTDLVMIPLHQAEVEQINEIIRKEGIVDHIKEVAMCIAI